MIEKRSQPRYLPKDPMPVTVQIGAQRVVGVLGDVSLRGCQILLPLAAMPLPRGASKIDGVLSFGDEPMDWDGDIIHTAPVRCHRSIGVRYKAPRTDIVDRLLDARSAGGLRVSRRDNATQAAVIGHLGFNLNRAFLGLVRQGTLRHVDLSSCSGLDSAGIGLLAIAREKGISFGGAAGEVRRLLDLARLVPPA